MQARWTSQVAAATMGLLSACPAYPDHLPRGIALQLVTLSLPTHLKDAHKQSAQQATI